MAKYSIVFIFILLMLAGCRSSILDDPTTRISYFVQVPSHVKVEVENSYDTIVATLIDQNQSNGQYSVSFDANKLPEGIYYYTIECVGTDTTYYYKSTKTLLLIK